MENSANPVLLRIYFVSKKGDYLEFSQTQFLRKNSLKQGGGMGSGWGDFRNFFFLLFCKLVKTQQIEFLGNYEKSIGY